VDGLTSSCKVSPLLHTCSRSGTLALQRWKLCFPITSDIELPKTAEKNERHEAKIFFDYKEDTLFFTQSFIDIFQFVQIECQEERMKIHSLAWDLTVLSSMFQRDKSHDTLLGEFDQQVRMAFILGEHEPARGRRGKMICFKPAKDPWDKVRRIGGMLSERRDRERSFIGKSENRPHRGVLGGYVLVRLEIVEEDGRDA
jgi:hypothetical protein